MLVNEKVIALFDELFMEDVTGMLDDDLFDSGILDSLGVVELIVHLEETFEIKVPISEFGRDDWSTVNKIIAGVKELKNA